MNRRVAQTLKSKNFLYPVVGITLCAIAVVFAFSSVKDKVIFPQQALYKITPYTDASNHGNSEIKDFSVTDSLLTLQYQLHEGFSSPYVGLTIAPIITNFIDAHLYNQVQITVAGEGVQRIGFAFYMPPLPGVKDGTGDETIYHTYLNINHQLNAYTIWLADLRYPEWWADLHQLSSDAQQNSDYSKILHVNISSAFAPNIQAEKKITLSEIRFVRDNSLLYLYIAIGYFMAVILLFVILHRKNFKKVHNEKIEINYKPIAVDESKPDDDSILEYINTHFQDSALNLELVASETGFSSRKITSHINDVFKCNFKTYINRIRIQEAQRLLTNTDLNIGEIAYKVGFNNQSHFNRVFKAEKEMNPTEYRENQH